jgi:hypothetical protein
MVRVAGAIVLAVCVQGCPMSSAGNGDGGAPIVPIENRGNGFLADGADPFPRDVPMIPDGDDASWRLPEGGIPFADERYGQVYFGLYVSQSSPVAFVNAVFRVKAANESGCDSFTLGLWTYQDCLGGELPDDHPRPFPNAGEFTIEGATIPITLPFLEDGRYDQWQVQREVFLPNQTLTLRALGGVVPPFTRTLRTTPSIQSQTLTGLVQNTIVRDRPIGVSWMPTTADMVNVAFRQRFSDERGDHDLSVSSQFAGDESNVTVPVEILSRLKPGRLVEVRVTPFTRDAFEVGSWPITLQYDGRATWQNITVQ